MIEASKHEVDLDEFSDLVSQNQTPEAIIAALGINKTKLKEILSKISMRYDLESSRWVRRNHQLGYFRWVTIESEVGEQYRFPQDLTPYMNKVHDNPAVYRWIVQDHAMAAIQCMYIGQTSNLIRRLKAYLYRNDQKIGKIMYQYAQNPNSLVKFQILSMSKRSLFDDSYSPLFDFQSQSDRCFIESKIISSYEGQGYELLNVLKNVNF